MKLENKLINRYRNLKLENKLVIGAFAVLGGVGLATNLGTSVETECETYQGYRNNSADGERIFVFDEHALRKRGINGPNYALSGDPKMYKDLKIGDKYRLDIWDPTLPLIQKRLLSSENCKSKKTTIV